MSGTDTPNLYNFTSLFSSPNLSLGSANLYTREYFLVTSREIPLINFFTLLSQCECVIDMPFFLPSDLTKFIVPYFRWYSNEGCTQDQKNEFNSDFWLKKLRFYLQLNLKTGSSLNQSEDWSKWILFRCNGISLFQ